MNDILTVQKVETQGMNQLSHPLTPELLSNAGKNGYRVK
jgi:hypothetical protein